MVQGEGLRMGGARGTPCRFRFDGSEIEAFADETVAAALWAVGIRTLRHSPEAHQPRGALCFMGSCQECVVETDAGVIEACRLRVRPGLVVRKVGYADSGH
jgi:predicted molibdopterin-dependent oxidoreductase YjgC